MALRFDQLARYLASDPVVWEVRTLAQIAQTQCWLVGGAVRDGLLGRTPKDADFLYVDPHVSDSPGLPRLFARGHDAPCIAFEHHVPVERVMLPSGPIDFVRIATPEELPSDLFRRDFTWNAMAYPLDAPFDEASVSGYLIDLVGGLEALEAREVRFSSPAVILDDPLRMLRAFRFALTLGFTLPASQTSLIRDHADLLTRPAGERVRDELMLILDRRGGAATLGTICDIGLLDARFPAIGGMRGVTQNPYHHLPVYEHTLECVSQLETFISELPPALAGFAEEIEALIGSQFVPGRRRIALMKLVLLFHDLGKPGTRTIRDDGMVTFIGHDTLSGTLMAPYLDDLKLSREEIAYIDLLVVQHLRPGFLDLQAPSLPRMLHRYFVDLGDSGVDLALISIADRLAAQGPACTPAHTARHWAIVERICHAYWRETALVVRPPDLITGQDLLDAFQVQPGAHIGLALRMVKEAQVDGTVSSREEALAHAKGFLIRE